MQAKRRADKPVSLCCQLVTSIQDSHSGGERAPHQTKHICELTPLGAPALKLHLTKTSFAFATLDIDLSGSSIQLVSLHQQMEE